MTPTGRGDSSAAHQPELITLLGLGLLHTDVVDKEGRTSGQLKWLFLTHLVTDHSSLQAQVGSNGVKLSVLSWKLSLQNPQGFQGTERGFADTLLPKETKVGLTQSPAAHTAAVEP